ncbi:MAG TPA: isoaspartyl peptidase/L-asparaginase [Kofleriaceae bacterium]|jgi:beta-aspartyl-peptidase (threonine type)
MIVVHGGAGRIGPERHARMRSGCLAAARVGHAILVAGGTALDAAIAAVRVLEDDPEYNAGTGAVLTREQTVETDAAVMDGRTQRVGAVAAVPNMGRAIDVARAVLDDGEHVLLAGTAALTFATERGIAQAPLDSLITERARQRFAEESARRQRGVAATSTVREGGTVGAVAMDRAGNFAAATSTGGIVYKRTGRVGDSPIPGAGTWADVRIAVSVTGDGEAVLRVALAHQIAMRVSLSGASLAGAVAASLADLKAITAGDAGVIAIDRHGPVIVHTTPTMPTAWIDDTGEHDEIDRFATQR